MKKYIFAAVFSLALLASPAFTQAASLTQAQINSIIFLIQSFGADQTTINNVQTSLGGGTTTGGGTQPWCHTFNRDLTVGSSGEDVEALTRALSSSGITSDDHTTTFAEDTAADVVKFQAKYGIRQTGYVGPITRAKLNSLYGCNGTTTPSITVLSPNGGDNWQIGNTYNIKWNVSGQLATRTVHLMGTINGVEVDKYLGSTDGNQLNYTVNSQISSVGSYVLRVCGAYCSGISSNPVQINVVDGTTQPSITVLSPNGGEEWQIGSQRTVYWNTNANTVNVMLRRESAPQTVYQVMVNSQTEAGGSYEWTIPAYLVPGNDYKILVNVPNSSGNANVMWDFSDAPFSIVAAGTTVPTPITLSSITPSSGPVGTSVRLDGCGSDSTSGFTLIYSGPKSGTASIPVETLGAASGCGYMTFSVPTDFPAGTYMLSVKNNQTDAMSTNSKTFTVTAPITGGVTGSSAACTTSFSPNAIKIGDYTTWNFAAGTGDTTLQYSCSSRFTKEDGTTPLSYGQLPLSGPWRIRVPGPLDCTLDSYNPNVIGSGSQCRASVAVTFFTITTASLPNASVNTPYNVTLATTNAGTAPYQWSWSPASSGSGVLPAGLTLNPSTGVISGTPSTAGKYDVAIKVTDAAGNVPTKTLALYVDAQAGASTQCTTSFSPSSANIGDVITWNFQSGAGDTTFQYSCNHAFTKEDGTTPLSYGPLPSSGSWRIKVPGYGFDCTLSSYNPSVIGSGSTCRAILKASSATNTYSNPGLASALGAFSGATNPVTQSTSGFNYTWNRDLQIGSPYQGDVIALQQALTREGVYAGEITGGFYNQTYAAVKSFQQKYGIDATGYVGQLTRSKLNILFAQR